MSNVYLQSQGIDNNPIEKMRGIRFNVQFNNAGGIFFLKDVILKYLLQSKMALNYTQQLIVDSLQNRTLICICQALGMISKTITGPYWKAASDKNTPIEMGYMYTRLIDVLDNIVKSPSLLYNNIKLFFGSEKDCHDIQDIFKVDENRNKTYLFISKLCYVIMEKAKKLFSDFLYGGKFYNADDDLKTTARTCPSNNITVERLMGKLDSAIKQSPNSSVGAIETKIAKKGKPLSVQELTTNLRKLIFHRNPFNDPESLLNKEIVHTWEDDNTSEQTCWNGRLLSYQNQEFEVDTIESSYFKS
ncbi:unnamed protein product [Mytilus coruscus]|uniref:Uncharacterized protein n=1 Tax=Mytilus coruscus TaxID=42192 RepID=A0A6J8E1J5_MYTCO|nr:unnamed protein product [Mytilus coruscus]